MDKLSVLSVILAEKSTVVVDPGSPVMLRMSPLAVTVRSPPMLVDWPLFEHGAVIKCSI